MMAGTQVGAHQSLYRPWESSACRIHTQLSTHMYTGNTCIDVHTDREVDRPGQWEPGPRLAPSASPAPSGAEGARARVLGSTGWSADAWQRTSGQGAGGDGRGDTPVPACPGRPPGSRGLPGGSFLMSAQVGRGPAWALTWAPPRRGDIKGCGCLTPPSPALCLQLVLGGVWGGPAAGLTGRGQVRWQSFHAMSACRLRPRRADRRPGGAIHLPSSLWLQGIPEAGAAWRPAPSPSPIPHCCSGGSWEPGRAGWLSGTCRGPARQLRPAPRRPLPPHRGLRV